jgi:hypothetical protein
MRSILNQGGPTIVQRPAQAAAKTDDGNIDDCGDLFKAAKEGNVEKIKQILEGGKDNKKVNEICKACRSITPVIAAAISGQQEAVEVLCDYGADITIRDIDNYTIFKLSLDAKQRDIANYLVCRYPDIVITDPRLSKGALWLTNQFWNIYNNIPDEGSKPPKRVLDYLLTGDENKYASICDRTVSEIYWEHILLRYIGDTPCDIRRNYSEELKMAFVGTFDRILYGQDGIKESARLLNCVLPTTAYNVYGTHVVSECPDKGWVTERWSYDDEDTKTTVNDGIDTFLIENGKILVMLINYRVYKDGKFIDDPEECKL